MPRRRLRSRQKRISDQVIEQLRDAVRSGCPWEWNARLRGSVDLLGLVKGYWYGLEDFCKTDERRQFVWEELREDILEQHVKYRPATRPAAWWKYDSTEPLRVLRREYRQPIHESEHEYLTRHGLLTDLEKEIFSKYRNIVLVRVTPGEFGKCEDCWREADKIAREIGFDLKAARSDGDFWIPKKLFIGCGHEPAYLGGGYNGIFEER